MKKIILTNLIVFIISSSFGQYQKAPDFANKVYDDIFNTMNDGKVIRPKLVISNNPAEVATYNPKEESEPLIILGINFIQLIRNFGKDSCNALAHVIGHELAHVILRQNDLISSIGSGYASVEYNRGIKKYKKVFQDSIFERQADEFAALYAHMAGYQTTGIGETLLDSIYIRFKLSDSKLSRYPKLVERKKIVRLSEQKMKVLKMFFDASILSAISENHEMSETFNRAIISENFPSREIHNNLGVSSLIQAIKLLDSLEYPYRFPVSFDLNTRLTTTSERNLDNQASEFLNKAHFHFSNALKSSPEYYVAWLNEAIVHFILNNEKLYNVALINLSDCKDSEILDKLEILKIIKADHNSRKKYENQYMTLCKKGNNYACSKIETENRGDQNIQWPPTLSFLKDMQNPKFDFTTEDAKKSDTLNKILSVSKNDFRYRKLVFNGIIGERWYSSNVKIKPIEIYNIHSQNISYEENNFFRDYFQFIGVYSKNIYYKWKDIFVVINNQNANFYLIN